MSSRLSVGDRVFQTTDVGKPGVWWVKSIMPHKVAELGRIEYSVTISQPGIVKPRLKTVSELSLHKYFGPGGRAPPPSSTCSSISPSSHFDSSLSRKSSVTSDLLADCDKLKDTTPVSMKVRSGTLFCLILTITPFYVQKPPPPIHQSQYIVSELMPTPAHNTKERKINKPKSLMEEMNKIQDELVSSGDEVKQLLGFCSAGLILLLFSRAISNRFLPTP